MVPEALDGHLGGEAVVGSKGPPAAVAVAQRRARVVVRFEVERIAQPLAYAAALEVHLRVVFAYH